MVKINAHDVYCTKDIGFDQEQEFTTRGFLTVPHGDNDHKFYYHPTHWSVCNPEKGDIEEKNVGFKAKSKAARDSLR